MTRQVEECSPLRRCCWGLRLSSQIYNRVQSSSFVLRKHKRRGDNQNGPGSSLVVEAAKPFQASRKASCKLGSSPDAVWRRLAAGPHSLDTRHWHKTCDGLLLQQQQTEAETEDHFIDGSFHRRSSHSPADWRGTCIRVSTYEWLSFDPFILSLEPVFAGYDCTRL